MCDPIDGSPPGSPCPWDSPGKNTGVGCHFLLQCIKVKVKSLSHVRLLATPWTAAYQAPPFMGFSRQEYWSGVPLPSPRLQSREMQRVSSVQFSRSGISKSLRPHELQHARPPCSSPTQTWLNQLSTHSQTDLSFKNGMFGFGEHWDGGGR